MIGIVSCELGNIASVYNGFEVVGHKATIITRPEQIKEVDKLVLPGVGAFNHAMAALSKHGFDGAIKEFAKSGKFLFGICLGMQLLFSESSEIETTFGLDLIKGRVGPLKDEVGDHPVPHVGWNDVHFEDSSILGNALKDQLAIDRSFYFVHSFFCRPEQEARAIGTTDYSFDFVSYIENENIFACQFHPEKSQGIGLALLDAFGKL